MSSTSQRERLLTITVVLFAGLMLLSGVAVPGAIGTAGADNAPLVPAEYYGEVIIEGEPAPVGTEITAKIAGEERGSINITEEGTYGDDGPLDDRLSVSGDENDIDENVTFFVERPDDNNPTEVEITQPESVKWENGDLQEIDLFANAAFDVTIDDVSDDVSAGNNITVDYTIENIASQEVTQDIEFAIVTDGGDGTEIFNDTKSDVTLSAGDTVSDTFEYETDETDTGTVEVAVSSDDTTDTESVTITSDNSFFEVNVTDTPTEVVEGEEIEVNYTVENIGNDTRSKDVNFTVTANEGEGETLFSDTEEDVELDFRETVSDTFNYSTKDGDAGIVEVEVETEDDDATRNVSVAKKPFFKVADLDAPDSATTGEKITVNATVNNTGGVEATRNITYALNESDGNFADPEIEKIINDSLTLGAGETQTVSIDVDAPTETGDYTHGIFSEDDNETAQLSVIEEALFNVSDFEAPEDSIEGENITVNATVENIGDEEATQQIDYQLDDVDNGFADPDIEKTINNSLTLNGGESTDVSIEIDDANLPEPGDYAHGIFSNDTNSTAEIGILAGAEYQVETIDAPSEVVEGENIFVDYEINNTGDVDGTQDIQFEVTDDRGAGDKVFNSTQEDVQISPNGSFTDQFTYSTDSGDVDDIEVNVSTEDDSATQEVTVLEESFFNVSLENVDNTVTAGADKLNFDVTVENTGEAKDTQDLILTFAGEEQSEEVTLDGGEQETFDSDTFNFELTLDDVGNKNLIASTADDNAVSSVSVEAPAFYEIDIIDAETSTQVTKGQDVTITADIENTGDQSGDKTITATFDEDKTRDITLDPGEITTTQFTFGTDNLDVDGAKTITAAVEESDNNDDSDSINITVDEADDATYTVDITEAPNNVDEPRVDGNVTMEDEIEVEIENIGEQDGEQDIEFFVNGELRETVTGLELDGQIDGGNSSITLDEDDFDEIPVNRGDTPEINLEVQSNDDSDSRIIDVNALPEFAVRIDDNDVDEDEIVDKEDTFTPEFTVENIGDQNGEVVVGATFANEFANQRQFDLSGGDSVSDEIEVNVSALDPPNASSLALELNATNLNTEEVDRTSLSQIPFGEDAEFQVTSVQLDPSNEVVVGEELDIDVSIENVGDEEGTQPITVDFAGDPINLSTVELDSGETKTLNYSYIPVSSAVDGTQEDRSATVSSNDDEKSEDITVVTQAEFAVNVRDVTPIAGDSFEVLVNVINFGGNEATTDLGLVVDGESGTSFASKELTLNGRDNKFITFNTTNVEAPAAGTTNITAYTTDDIDTETVVSGRPGELELELRSVTDPATIGEEINVSVRAENVGDTKIENTDLRLVVNGNSLLADGDADITVPGGESVRETLTTVKLTKDDFPDVSEDNYGEAIVQVHNKDDLTDARSVEIRPEPDSALFRLSTLDAPNSVLQPAEGDNTEIDVGINIRNIGDKSDTQTIALNVDGDQKDTAESVQLNSGASATRTLQFNVTSDDVGDLEVEVSSDNRTVADTLTVEEARPAQPEIVDTTLNSSLNQEEQLVADIKVKNTGDRKLDSGTAVLDYLAEDSDTGEADAMIPEIDPGENDTVTVGLEVPVEPRAGEFDREAEIRVANNTNDVTDQESRSFTVDFEDISSGVDAANAGETVEIAPGTYEERNTLTIDTEGVTLTAADRTNRPVIESPRQDDNAIEVTAGGVTINQTILNGDGDGSAITTTADSTIQFVTTTNWDTGITEEDGTLTTQAARIFNTDVGISLTGSSGSDVSFATIRDTTTGINIESAETSVQSSRVSNATNIGVNVAGNGGGSEVTRSTIRQNNIGIRAVDLGTNNPDNFLTVRNSNLERNGISTFALDSVIIATDGIWWGSPGLIPTLGSEYLERSEVRVGTGTDNPVQPEINVNAVNANDVVFDTTQTVTFDIENEGGAGDAVDIQSEVVDTNDNVVISPDPIPVTVDSGEDSETTGEITFDIDQRFRNNNGEVLDNATINVFTADDPEGEEIEFNITDDALDDIKIDLDDETIEEGKTTTATVTEIKVDGSEGDIVTDSATLNSSDDSIATINDDGTVTGQNPGDVTITATYNGESATAQLTVQKDSQDGDTSTSSGGSGGGGADIDDEPTDDAPPTVTDVRDTLNLVEPSTTTQTEIADNNPDTPGTQITPEGTELVRQISFDEDELSGNVDITEYTNPPQQIREDVASSVTAAGAAAEGSSINTISVADITPDNDAAEDSAATVTFAVPASEVTNPEQLTVFKETYSQEQQEDTWTKLDTTVEQEGDEEITISARAESFSLFAVSEVEPADDDQQQQDDGQDDGQDDDQQDGSPPTALIVVGLLIILAAIGAFIYMQQNE